MAVVLQDFYHVSGRFRERFIVPGATLDSVEQHLDIVNGVCQILQRLQRADTRAHLHLKHGWRGHW